MTLVGESAESPPDHEIDVPIVQFAMQHICLGSEDMKHNAGIVRA
jgi:hypothetical protein